MIKRRSAMSKIIAGVAGMISLPAWADSWSLARLGPFRRLSQSEDESLAAIVDTLIPATDTPGAKELGVHQLIQKIVADCYDTPDQNSLSMGLVLMDAVALGNYGSSFRHLNPEQRLEVLKKMANSPYPDQKNFLSMVKRLTIDGYMKSEYVMTNITKFELAPNRFYGCRPV